MNRRKDPSGMGAWKAWSNLSMDLWSKAMETSKKMTEDWMGAMQSMGAAAPAARSDHGVPCCPPEQECPPRCLMHIKWEAHAGEVIMAPFGVKNKCGQEKTYRIGVRPIVDQDGNELSVRPQLDKELVTLQPGQTVQMRMRLDLSEGFSAGHTYQTDIVLREADVNQNICFTLHIPGAADGPVACPLEESVYFNRFQSWDSHFYCEKRPGQRITITRAETQQLKK